MRFRFNPLTARLAAALILVQALWSGIATTAYAAGFEGAKYFCSTVALDAEARAQLAELMALTGLEDPQDHEPVYDPNDCPVCALGKTAVLTSGVSGPASMSDYGFAGLSLRLDQTSPRQTTGPPVGLRAPPVSDLI